MTLREGLAWETVTAYAETHSTESLVARLSSVQECIGLIEFAGRNGYTICPRGAGYTYADMILNDRQIILDISRMNRLLRWDPDAGIMTVEPGVRLSDIFLTALPWNWTLPACPGGMAVTVGGAVSNNVHGKDSWKNGNFGAQVNGLKLLTASGEILSLDGQSNPALFRAVIGGMGLFGIIIEVTLQLKKVPSPFVEVSTAPSRDIWESVEKLEDAKADSDFSVAWVDAFSTGRALGRGYVVKAKWAGDGEGMDRERLSKSLTLPTKIFGLLPAAPTWYLLRPFFRPSFLRPANSANYLLTRLKGMRKERMLFTEYNFMHNRIPELKRVFRPHGFLELQPLIPRRSGAPAVAEVFRLCQRHGFQSLLCGFKAHSGDDFMISYSGDGYSIGVSLQRRGRDPEKTKLFARALFEHTLNCGGKAFLAKDELLPRDIFERMYPQYKEFLEVKRAVDPEGLFKSDMYRRLMA